MAVQDLTPQLRTRLSRVERAVGLFVIVATLLLLAGFAFYLYSTAQRKGWTKRKFTYHAYVESAAGIRVGDTVTMMGFDVGRVTTVEAMPPFFGLGNVFVKFEIVEPYQGYIWNDSRVKVVDRGLLGQRGLELIEGGLSGRKDLKPTYREEGPEGNKKVTGVWDDQKGQYASLEDAKHGYWLNIDETPALTARAEKLVAQAEAALPGILDLTNRVNSVLTNIANMTAEANAMLVNAQPIVTNAAVIVANLKDPNGSLGKWIIPPDLNQQLTNTMSTANATLARADQLMASTDTNVTKLATGLDATIINLANITSNLNTQVQANSNLVSNINSAIEEADTMMQGLKRHWLLRSAFKEKKGKEEPTPARAPTPEPPPRTPEEQRAIEEATRRLREAMERN